MYEYLEGRLASRHPARLVLDVGGVGYDVAVPLGADFRPLPGSKEERVRVWTHFVVREDAQRLYGFPDVEGREIFRLLLSVRGVGPGAALAVLSSLPVDRLLAAIAGGDAAALTAVKGIGKKTAEQILLDLRDKAPRFAPATVGGDVLVPRGPGRSRHFHDAVQALVSIGYTDKQAERSVELAAKKVAEDDLELLVRTALLE